MSMTVEEALQRADQLKEQGCITPTAQALITLADMLRNMGMDKEPKPVEGA